MNKNATQEFTDDQVYLRGLMDKARGAMKIIEDYDQATIDRLCQAVGWAVAKEDHFKYLTQLSIDESGMGNYQSRCNKRFKIYGVLRDILGVKTMGIIEEIPEKGIVKYAKPAGVIAAIIPSTNPALTPPAKGLFALKCKDAVIFSPHPRTKKTTFETVRFMREALQKEGASVDLFQCIPEPTLSLANELMKQADLVMATGGKNLVRAAYSSGTPAYGVGAGNANVIVDETADIEEAAVKICMSKTNDNGSGCSADSNLIVEQTIYDRFLAQLQKEGGYLTSAKEKAQLESVMWDTKGARTPDTIAVSASKLAQLAGFSIANDKKFIIVEEIQVGKAHPFSGEKISPVLAVYKYSGFENSLKLLVKTLGHAGIGHSCGIYSYNDDHIHQLALVAKVSRIMVCQPQSLSNAGSWTNGMPMTASLGCGTWGGNITNENISLKHYMNVTWVSRSIPENKPSEKALFGEFLHT